MIVFSSHSIQRNKIRKIPKKRIVETIKNPQEIINSYRGRTIYRRLYRAKILEVVIKPEHDKIVVVTQYYVKEHYENKIRHKN
jgi:hypothetical protein